jgi:hypothetical protein
MNTTFNDIQAAFVMAYEEQKARRDVFEAKANKARETAKRYQRLAAQKMGEYYRLSHYSYGGDVHWTSHQVVPLLKEVNRRTGLNFDYSDLRTFGLGCECPVFVHDDNKKVIASLTFTPSFGRDLKLYIYSGEYTDNYASGTIAEMNGFNNVREEVTSIETIIDNLRRRFPELNL